MLHRLQAEYVDKPVRFLVVPCNNFKQEPKANSVIKEFAEQSVHLGNGSNVVMLAKSNVNFVKCTYQGADACMPSSTECCPKNDGVYDYLLANTAPGKIAWNFDKVIVGADGKPYPGETILHGGNVDADLKPIIDTLLSKGEAGTEQSFAATRLAQDVVIPYLAAAACVAVLVAAWSTYKARASNDAGEAEVSGQYYLVA